MVLTQYRQMPLGFFTKNIINQRMVITIRNVIMVMSLSGTLITLFWFIVYRLYFIEFKAKWLRNLILIAIPFFIFPVPFFRYLFGKLFLNTGINPFSLTKNIEGSIDTTYMIVIQKHSFILSICEKTLLIFMAFIAFVSILCITFQFYKYLKLKQAINKQKLLPLSNQEKMLFDEIKDRMQITQKIGFIKSTKVSVPFTIGIIHPIIIIPKNLPQNDTSLRIVLSHEFAHIKHRDVFFNLIACVILALHWFNIFSYIFLFILKTSNELYSDETATEILPDADKYRYCQLMIELSRNKNSLSDLFTLNFIGSKTKQIERRIDNIMKCKKRKFVMALLFGGIMFIIGFSLTFIYAGANEMEIENIDDFSYDSEEDFILETSISTPLLYEDLFIDENQNQYFCNNTEGIATCFHSYIKGTRRVHTTINNSCKREYYNAKRCALCGKVICYNLYNTESWIACPH